MNAHHQKNLGLQNPRTLLPCWTQVFDYRPSVGYAGADQWWARVAGQRILMGGSTSWLRHADAVGTTTMVTDQTGAVDDDALYYPWGQVWKIAGGSNGNVFGDLGYQINYPLPPSKTRDYNPTLGRWMVPDPGGVKVVKLSDPQTWNMYAYAHDNPTTFNDPSGLQGRKLSVIAMLQPLNLDPGRLAEKALGFPSLADLDAVQGRLSARSIEAIVQAAKQYGYKAAEFETAITTAAAKYGVNPNILVGLAYRESSLNPSPAPGNHGGLFQLGSAMQKQLKIATKDIGSFQAQIPKVAGELAGAIRTFHGNEDLGIASWTLGVAETQRLFSSGGMRSVRSAALARGHPEYGAVGSNYIDIVKRFLGP